MPGVYGSPIIATITTIMIAALRTSPFHRLQRQSLSAFIAAVISLLAVGGNKAIANGDGLAARQWLTWQPLPPLPDPIGLGGPFVGTHGDALIVVGGANFGAVDAADLWSLPKRYHAAAYVLAAADRSDKLVWRSALAIDRPIAYGACVSTPQGVVCLGGNDADGISAEAFLLGWNAIRGTLDQTPLPPLPAPSTAGGAAFIGGHVYLMAGQSGIALTTATDRVWRLDLAAALTGAADGRCGRTPRPEPCGSARGRRWQHPCRGKQFPGLPRETSRISTAGVGVPHDYRYMDGRW